MSTTTLDRPAPTVAPRRRLFTPSPIRRRALRPRAIRADDFIDRLGRMGFQQRLAAYRSGEFSRRERAIWAARFPEEVPLLNGELEWIAMSMVDLD